MLLPKGNIDLFIFSKTFQYKS